MKIAVVVPVYNGRAFLERTIRSLQAQRHADFTAYFVDDCSTDGGAELIQAYATRDARIVYLRTAQNLEYVSRVLNAVRDQIEGDAFAYASQDDFFSDDWLSSMVRRRQETGADAVVPRLVFYSAQTTGAPPLTLAGVNGNLDAVISGREAFAGTLNWSIPGNALWPIELLREHGFFDFAFMADEYTSRFYFLRCARVAFAEGTFFYNQDNPNAVTKKKGRRWFSTPLTDLRTYQLAKREAIEDPRVEGFYFKAVDDSITYHAQARAPELAAERALIEHHRVLIGREAAPRYTLNRQAVRKTLLVLAAKNRVVFGLLSGRRHRRFLRDNA